MKQIIVASAFIHKDGKVLVARRADTKAFLPGIFEIPGGKVEFGESPQQAVAREVKEELNLDVVVGEPFYVFTYTTAQERHAVEIEFFATLKDPGQEPQLNPEDHSEYRWVGSDEAAKIFTKNSQIAEVLAINPNHPIPEQEGEVGEALRRGFELLAKGVS